MEKNTKSRIYNVIILDKSGSMSSIRRQAVDGVNETLGAIRAAALKNPEVENYVTLVAFCGCEIKRIIDTKPIAQVENLTPDMYRPCCMTPLYDAVGSTITRLHEAMADIPLSTASVTIITDGYENASREFGHRAVKALIDAYKNEGWLFSYIGADHDVESVAFSLSIDNALTFDKSDEGVAEMSHKASRAMGRWNEMVSESLCCCMAAPSISREEVAKKIKEDSDKFSF